MRESHFSDGVAEKVIDGFFSRLLGGSANVSRLREQYDSETVPALIKHFKYQNVMAVPRLEKVVVNMGLGEAIQNSKILDAAVEELGTITGQRPIITHAKKSIANFKLREKMPIGAAATLRGNRTSQLFARTARSAHVLASVCLKTAGGSERVRSAGTY